MWHSRNHEESKDYRHCAGRGGHFRGGFGRFGHGRGHGHDGGGFGRRRGLYDSDELRLVLLSLIAEKPRHGYDLIKEIEERSGGTYTPSPGVIYPTLTMLQDMGHIVESDAAGTRKVYAVTQEGTAHLAQNKEHADELIKENRYALSQIIFGGFRLRPVRGHEATSIKYSRPVCCEKIVKHRAV